ncbi:hypothetical protein BABINDRAFT_35937 [Babjeviella inositovora NRRL Y-12698]|uniref:Cytochrome b-c1 complex subunit 7 n=1 Tax=Babjeviella inositovora NRRL Y-12698 TaxID=984486 RepID=A0A1E3QTB9_9ASCO|nr:uncharacterized protein BABINDRAFT_35937 [Babjeviella inositovora NRRL Y-12698]ODQ80262.1 hypothetical protein BABINDRAFT_35937 [Babjeviella inositovora NRRL Y-12698]
MASLTSVHNMARWVSRTPVLKNVVPAIAKKYTELAGYREMGLRLDDLLLEETPVMQTAIKRLSDSESYARNFRILTAHQCAISHQLLPKDKAVSFEDDVPYLTPYILEAEMEAAEKAELDEIVVSAK